ESLPARSAVQRAAPAAEARAPRPPAALRRATAPGRRLTRTARRSRDRDRQPSDEATSTPGAERPTDSGRGAAPMTVVRLRARSRRGGHVSPPAAADSGAALQLGGRPPRTDRESVRLRAPRSMGPAALPTRRALFRSRPTHAPRGCSRDARTAPRARAVRRCRARPSHGVAIPPARKPRWRYGPTPRARRNASWFPDQVRMQGLKTYSATLLRRW